MSQTEIALLDKGFVKLVDRMGGDARVVQAARNSLAPDPDRGLRKPQSDEALIRYLMRHRHTTPFEQVVFTLDMKMPVFVARQLVRHRTQAINEMSGRYSVIPDEWYVPSPENIQGQAKGNKQGRDGVSVESAEFEAHILDAEAEESFGYYTARLGRGVARELARINLPQSAYTQWWTTISLHNLLHLIGLRWDSHAQWETREYGRALGEIVAATCPLTWAAFLDFRRGAVMLSRLDVMAMRWFTAGLDVRPEHWPTRREVTEFIEKARTIGLALSIDGDYLVKERA